MPLHGKRVCRHGGVTIELLAYVCIGVLGFQVLGSVVSGRRISLGVSRFRVLEFRSTGFASCSKPYLESPL